MDKPMTFNEWMGTKGNLALVHANCCRIAYEAGQQHQQAKVEELQKQLIDQGQRFNDQAQRGKDLEYKNGELQKRVNELERMLEIKWADEQIAPQRHSGNRIIYGSCVLGKFSIWWRTWKEYDRPALEINDDFITEACDVEEAKQMAKSYLEQALKGQG